MSAQVSQERWGEWPSFWLRSGTVSLLLVPGIGARIVSLRDLRSGREWLRTGQPPSRREASEWARHEASFDGRTSFGWDECLPTVAPCPDPLDARGVPLRDHGDQWGRPTTTSVADGRTSLVTRWADARWPYALERRLSLEGEATVLSQYTVRNEGSQDLPLLWSMHPVLSLEAGTRLQLPDVAEARLTWANGLAVQGGDITWPSTALADGTVIDLARVRSGEGWAAKLYARAPGPVRAVTPDGASLELDWDRAFASALGIWLDYGAWPPDGPSVEQVALEPTTSGDDHLQSALEGGRAVVLGAGRDLEWWVRIRLTQ